MLSKEIEKSENPIAQNDGPNNTENTDTNLQQQEPQVQPLEEQHQNNPPHKIPIKENKKALKIGVVTLSALVIILAIWLGIKQVAKKQYQENYDTIVYFMVSSAADAEEYGNLIASVWYNAIYEERDSETDKYTRPNGYFVSDFNDALQNLFADEEFLDNLQSIETQASYVENLLPKLQNPPEEFTQAYNALVNSYNAYATLIDLVINPQGSLFSYQREFSDADSEAASALRVAMLYIDAEN